MPTPYTPTSNWTTTVDLADDGDPRNVASVNTPLEAALDRTKWLRDRLDGTASGAHLDTPTIDDPTLTGNVDVSSATLTGTLTSVSGGSFAGIMSAEAFATVEERAPDADTFAPSPPKGLYIVTVLTGDHFFQMGTGIVGQVVRFITFEAAHTLTIKDGGGLTMLDPSGNSLILKAGAAGFFNELEIVYSHVAGDKWVFAAGTPN